MAANYDSAASVANSVILHQAASVISPTSTGLMSKVDTDMCLQLACRETDRLQLEETVTKQNAPIL